MKNLSSFNACFILACLLMICNACAEQNDQLPQRMMTSNESFINGLYAGLKLDSMDAVFAYAFSKLNDEVTVYPSENYYYFRFPARGKMIYGTFTLFPSERDSGQIGFGYAAKVEDKRRNREYFVRGDGKKYGLADGVKVSAQDEDVFLVEYRDKTVRFKLFDPGFAFPAEALLDGEEYVGSNFDESGLRFHLLFNTNVQRLFWILNEDGFVPETFSPTQFGHSIIRGDRTEFLFFNDSTHSRKILVGVSGWNVNHNNWYDGPFDQLPDNYVRAGKIDMKKYIVASFGIDSTKIDKYGRYSAAHRVPVAPYTVYYSDLELDVFEICINIEDANEKLACLTEQRFELPRDFYHNINRRYY